MNKLLFIIVIVLQNCTLYSQTPSVAGIWVLKDRQTISGPDYANGIPKMMVIAVTTDSLLVKRTYDGGGKSEYIINEDLPLNGNPVVALRTVSKRNSFLKKGNDVLTFSIEVTYRDVNTGKQTSADFVERWKFSPSSKELVLEKNARESDGSSWGMKGLYELKTAEQVAQEQSTGKGIEFVENLSWDQIKAKAKAQNKFIFVDCYATWCLPCKKMEQEIFPLNIVGAALNDQFIAVRLQMDTTKKDNDQVKAWYPVGHSFLQDYQIVGYPTFLFFDLNGKIVHKGLGTYKADEFINLLSEATNANKQYYSLLLGYNAGDRNPEKMYQLLKTAKKLGETKEAERVLNDYKKEWLYKLPVDSLLTQKYLQLAVEFQQSLIRQDGSKGSFFRLLYQKGKQVDAMLNMPGFASFHVNGVITEEEIDNKIYNNGKPFKTPQWDKIKATIQEKYVTVDANKLLLDQQIRYSQIVKDWSSLAQYLVRKVEQYGPLSLGQADGSGSDNTITNLLLPHCDDPVILNKAVRWLEQIIQSNSYMYPIAMIYGNYGAILYKAGKRKEGIDALEKQLNAIGYKSPADLDKDPRFKEKLDYLERMKRGEKIDASWKPYVFN